MDYLLFIWLCLYLKDGELFFYGFVMNKNSFSLNDSGSLHFKPYVCRIQFQFLLFNLLICISAPCAS